MQSIENLQHEKQRLERDLERVSSELIERKGHENSTTTSAHGKSNALTPGSRSGYLFKWQDRTIGWGGTKWDLRFFRLTKGRLSYYKTHHETSPRFAISLGNCAVRDDGCKPNKRFRPKNKNEPVTLRTPGAYYHVFSIYQRPKGTDENVTAEFDAEDDIVPILRFSTENLAQKIQWMEFLAASCAYCNSDDFKEEEEEDWDVLRTAMLPAKHATKGTLPLLYFAPHPVKLKRCPSNAAIRKSASHMKLNKSKDSAKSNSKRTSDYPPSKPMHRNSEPSYLSDEAPMQNYRGLLNLALIILFISNFRILLGTMREYGFVLTYGVFASSERHYQWADVDVPLVAGLLLLNAFVLIAYGVELCTSRNVVSEWFGILIHVINCNAALFLPMWIVWYKIEAPPNASLLMMCSTILWMKLISYVHANADYRHFPERSNHNSTSLMQDVGEASTPMSYPSNVTLSNIYYFWFAPTLTYQISFPRLPERNFARIFTLSVRLFLSFVLVVFLIAQVVSPALSEMTKELDQGKEIFSLHIFADYLLKLGMASTYIWLLVFYGYFHVFFNLLAEILKFGDRVFYRDWWNSSNLSSYWRLWNIPVHYWLVRHLYFPCIRIGVNKQGAMFVVFFFSAVIHEMMISIPFHMIRSYSFLGMMSQIPLVMITKYIDKVRPGSSLGNIIFWLSFCILGQPMAIILYTIDYWKLSSIEPTEICNESWWRKSCGDNEL